MPRWTSGCVTDASDRPPAGDAPLNRVMHEPHRRAIVSELAQHPALGFGVLKQRLGLSDGNLSMHTRKLEEAGYITCNKSFEGRLPRTEYTLTPTGRAALQAYTQSMETESAKKP